MTFLSSINIRRPFSELSTSANEIHKQRHLSKKNFFSTRPSMEMNNKDEKINQEQEHSDAMDASSSNSNVEFVRQQRFEVGPRYHDLKFIGEGAYGLLTLNEIVPFEFETVFFRFFHSRDGRFCF